jgi:hypothetical protein
MKRESASAILYRRFFEGRPEKCALLRKERKLAKRRREKRYAARLPEGDIGAR